MTPRAEAVSDLDNLSKDVPHARAAYRLGLILGRSFEDGIGDPGGWVILAEPRIGFQPQVMVPDLAGWRRERYQPPPSGPFQVFPDWICEILSPSTEPDDRIRKLPSYARNGVCHVWLVKPEQLTLEIFRLQEGIWLLVGVHGQDDKVRAEPFDAIEIDLSQIWGEMQEGGATPPP